MYQRGRKTVISDALSHLSTHQISDTKETVPGLNVTIHEVGPFSNTDNTSMQNIQKETQNDAELQTLLQYIMKGFPMTKDEVMMPSNLISTIERNLLWLMVLYLKATALLSQIS